MVPPHPIDTKNPAAVADAVKAAFGRISAQASFPLLDRLFADVTSMFNGKYPGYLSIDMQYHDYEHTLQATVCLIHLLEGRHRSGDTPVLSARTWELSVMAVLLHDCGYLKYTDDREGTGANTPWSMSGGVAILPAATCLRSASAPRRSRTCAPPSTAPVRKTRSAR